ncbi:MAG: hypothetical protein KGJ41_17925 [Rhodospirillales bacterium]|nr:hypothetical protein [Rhodospirillales bacterium]MDE2200892.1 hypothetical protein [Rhodospirillales bacterium]MDE2575038.1 hypothetical protein [Rhodospirillales bacterium]
MQYLVVAHDGTDAGAQSRRQAARPLHLAFIEPLVAAGRIMIGGPLLDDAGAMIGSAVIADFPTRDALDQWLASDPYATGGVWKQVQVTPMRVAAAPPA